MGCQHDSPRSLGRALPVEGEVMDHRAAIEMAYRSAEAHLGSLKRQQGEAGLPCRTCRWANDGAYSWNKTCRHPFLKRGQYDAITGETKWQYPSHTDARRSNCGLAAVLHEPAGYHALAWRWARRAQWPFFIMVMLGAMAFVFTMIWLGTRP